MKKLIMSSIAILFLCACNSSSNETNIEKIMAENDYIIVDVRTEEEYKEGHIVDAINIPYNELDDNLDKDTIIFVYCKSGNRSNIAYETLTDLGYTVYDLGAFSNIDLPKE